MDVADIDVSKPRGRRAIVAAANAALRTHSPAPPVSVPVSVPVVDAALATDRVRAERAVERAMIERGGAGKCTIKRDRTVVRLRTKKVP